MSESSDDSVVSVIAVKDPRRSRTTSTASYGTDKVQLNQGSQKKSTKKLKPEKTDTAQPKPAKTDTTQPKPAKTDTAQSKPAKTDAAAQPKPTKTDAAAQPTFSQSDKRQIQNQETKANLKTTKPEGQKESKLTKLTSSTQEVTDKGVKEEPQENKSRRRRRGRNRSKSTEHSPHELKSENPITKNETQNSKQSASNLQESPNYKQKSEKTEPELVVVHASSKKGKVSGAGTSNNDINTNKENSPADQDKDMGNKFSSDKSKADPGAKKKDKDSKKKAKARKSKSPASDRESVVGNRSSIETTDSYSSAATLVATANAAVGRRSPKKSPRAIPRSGVKLRDVISSDDESLTSAEFRTPQATTPLLKRPNEQTSPSQRLLEFGKSIEREISEKFTRRSPTTGDKSKLLTLPGNQSGKTNDTTSASFPEKLFNSLPKRTSRDATIETDSDSFAMFENSERLYTSIPKDYYPIDDNLSDDVFMSCIDLAANSPDIPSRSQNRNSTLNQTKPDTAQSISLSRETHSPSPVTKQVSSPKPLAHQRDKRQTSKSPGTPRRNQVEPLKLPAESPNRNIKQETKVTSGVTNSPTSLKLCRVLELPTSPKGRAKTNTQSRKSPGTSRKEIHASSQNAPKSPSQQKRTGQDSNAPTSPSQQKRTGQDSNAPKFPSQQKCTGQDSHVPKSPPQQKRTEQDSHGLKSPSVQNRTGQDLHAPKSPSQHKRTGQDSHALNSPSQQKRTGQDSHTPKSPSQQKRIGQDSQSHGTALKSPPSHKRFETKMPLPGSPGSSKRTNKGESKSPIRFPKEGSCSPIVPRHCHKEGSKSPNVYRHKFDHQPSTETQVIVVAQTKSHIVSSSKCSKAEEESSQIHDSPKAAKQEKLLDVTKKKEHLRSTYDNVPDSDDSMAYFTGKNDPIFFEDNCVSEEIIATEKTPLHYKAEEPKKLGIEILQGPIQGKIERVSNLRESPIPIVDKDANTSDKLSGNKTKTSSLPSEHKFDHQHPETILHDNITLPAVTKIMSVPSGSADTKQQKTTAPPLQNVLTLNKGDTNCQPVHNLETITINTSALNTEQVAQLDNVPTEHLTKRQIRRRNKKKGIQVTGKSSFDSGSDAPLSPQPNEIPLHNQISPDVVTATAASRLTEKKQDDPEIKSVASFDVKSDKKATECLDINGSVAKNSEDSASVLNTITSKTVNEKRDHVPPPSPSACEALHEIAEEDEEKGDVDNVIDDKHREVLIFGESVLKRLSSLVDSQCDGNDLERKFQCDFDDVGDASDELNDSKRSCLEVLDELCDMGEKFKKEHEGVLTVSDKDSMRNQDTGAANCELGDTDSRSPESPRSVQKRPSIPCELQLNIVNGQHNKPSESQSEPKRDSQQISEVINSYGDDTTPTRPPLPKDAPRPDTVLEFYKPNVVLREPNESSDDEFYSPMRRFSGEILKVPDIEETFTELMSVKNILQHMEDKTPTSEVLPRFAGADGLTSPPSYLNGSGRRSRMSPAITERTESELDMSEQLDNLSVGTDSMYADDEDDEPEMIINKTYTEERGGECQLSYTFYNTTLDHDVDSDEFWQDSCSAAEESYKILESSANQASCTFKKARNEMHEIHRHLQDLRRQMEYLQDDVQATSLTPSVSLGSSEWRPPSE